MNYDNIEDRIMSVASAMANQFYILYAEKKFKEFKPANKKSFMFGGKYFKYFTEAANMFCLREGFEPEKFIKCQFEKHGIVYPAQISHENAWKTFEEYEKFTETEVDEEKSLAEELTSAYAQLHGKSVRDFFNISMNRLYLENGRLFPYVRFFCFSKHFVYDLYEPMYDRMEKKFDCKTMRTRVLQYPRLVKWLKEKLKDDYYE